MPTHGGDGQTDNSDDPISLLWADISIRRQTQSFDELLHEQCIPPGIYDRHKHSSGPPCRNYESTALVSKLTHVKSCVSFGSFGGVFVVCFCFWFFVLFVC